MSTENLEISIDANIQGAVKGVEDFVKVVEKAESPVFDLDKAVKAAMDRISANIDKMADEATRSNVELEKSIGPVVSEFMRLKTAAGSASGVFNGATLGAAKFIPKLKDIPPALEKTSKSTNTASIALTNLGRVAQDAPFGFIGIANNLNPLLESFQRLKAESGSTGGALKALGGSLMGAGGLGLALSAVTAAVTFAQMGFRAWGVSATKAKEDTDKFAESLKDAKAGAMQTGVQLQGLVNIARDNTQSLETRNTALREANKLMGEHGEKLTLVNVGTQKVTEEINNYTNALIAQAVAERLSGKIADQKIAQLDAIDKVAQAQKRLGIANKNVANLNRSIADQERATNEIVVTDRKQAANELKEAEETYKSVTKGLQTTASQFQTALLESSDLFGKVGFKEKIDKVKKDVEKGTKELSSVIGGFLGALDSSGSLGKNRLIITIATQFEKNEIKKNFEDLVKFVNDFNIPASVGKLGIVAPIKQALDELEKERLRLDKIKADFQASLGNLAEDLTVGFAESIGNLIGGMKNPFAPLIGMLGQGLISLGKQVIATSTIMVALKKALSKLVTNPILSLGVGVAMVALGSLLKSKVSQAKFAEGGIVSGPMNAQIGEAGQSEVILPLSRLSGLLSNSGFSGRVEFEISGQKLLGVMSRASSSRGRTYG